MALTYDPFRSLERAFFDTRQSPLMPMDLYRDGDVYVLNADLPGIDPGSVDIDIDGQVLTLRAERTMADNESVKWLTRERRGGTFVRQLNLGSGIDTDAISAHYNNGVLSVTIPVSEKAKPRKVAVQSGAPAEQPVLTSH